MTDISSREVELKMSDDTYILKHVYDVLSICDRVQRISAEFGPDYNAVCIVMKDGTKKILILKEYEGE